MNLTFPRSWAGRNGVGNYGLITLLILIVLILVLIGIITAVAGTGRSPDPRCFDLDQGGRYGAPTLAQWLKDLSPDAQGTARFKGNVTSFIRYEGDKVVVLIDISSTADRIPIEEGRNFLIKEYTRTTFMQEWGRLNGEKASIRFQNLLLKEAGFIDSSKGTRITKEDALKILKIPNDCLP